MHSFRPLAVAFLGLTVQLQSLVHAQLSGCTGNVELKSGHLLQVGCADPNGDIVTQQEDLNLCVGNNNGQLVAQNNGGFSSSCKDCALITEYTHTTLSCRCEVGGFLAGSFVFLELIDFITINDGVLWCEGHQSANEGKA